MGNLPIIDQQRSEPGLISAFLQIPQLGKNCIRLAPVPAQFCPAAEHRYWVAAELWCLLYDRIYVALLPQGRVLDRNGKPLLNELPISMHRTVIQLLENLLDRFSGPLIKSAIEAQARLVFTDTYSFILSPDAFLSADDLPETLLHLLKNPFRNGLSVSAEAGLLVKYLVMRCHLPCMAEPIAKVRSLSREEIIVLNRLSYKYFGFRLEKFSEIEVDEKVVILAWVNQYFDVKMGKPKLNQNFYCQVQPHK